MSAWRHWRLEQAADGRAELFLAVADRPVNVLHREALDELEEVLERLVAQAPSGVILGTEPARGFALGADVGEFAQLESRKQALDMLQRGQELFEGWAGLECPTVAAIRGYCLGGGLELALACDYRVAESEPDATLGLPEVRLGIHPGYGGSVRLPERIGDAQALRLMLTGQTVSGRQAARLRLVDAAVPRRQLYARARLMLDERPAPSRAPWHRRAPHVPALRRVVARLYARNLRSRVAKSHYPAPYRLLEHWSRMGARPEEALESEAQSVADLFEQPGTRQLTRMFLLRQELKGQAPADAAPASVHVVGAGVMGGDIAIWCAVKGLRVSLEDADPNRIGPVIARARKLLARRPEDARAALDRLVPDPEGHGAGQAELVIEAIFEDLEAKRELYRRLQAQMRPEALLATNTSSLPLEELATALDDPARLIGVHFFNPVSRMPLVELIHHHPEQAPLVDRAAGFVRHLGRVPLRVRSAPGFLVNRVLMPYLLEAMRLLEEEKSAATVDRAATACGMPVGPLELADRVGLDVCLAAGSVLAEAYGLEVPQGLRRKVEAGDLGKKTGRGFYRWKGGRAKSSRPRKPSADCAERLILSMVREAVHCLDEGLVERADWIDAGLVLATGFVPFSGGPLEMVRRRGAGSMRRQLEQLEQRYGPRFAPGPGWDAEDLRRAAP